MNTGFHVHEGWYFERLNNGKEGAGVRVYQDNGIDPRREITMDLASWISVVTELAGGTAEIHEAATKLYRA